MNTTVVILAAGLGTRMRSKRAKVLHRAGGLTLIEHVVAAASAITPPDEIVVVTGHQAEEVEALLLSRRDLQGGSTAAATLITTTLANPAGYGRVLLEGVDRVQAIVEDQDCT